MSDLSCYHCRTPLAAGVAVCPACQSPQLLTRGSKHYRITGVLGSGGFGRVFDATEEPVLLRRCAIKRIHEDPPRLTSQMIRREVTVLSSQGHRLGFIPDVYDYWEEQTAHYIVMQYIAGETLDKVHVPPWPLDQTVSFLADLLQRLSQLHEAGIVHRDIKPRNIKYHKQRGYILLDFGLASNLGGSALQGFTPDFAPPEQFGDGDAARPPPDQRSDLYSLAATSYYLLTGWPPARTPDWRRGGGAPQLTFPAQVPPELADLLRQMLAPRSDQRPSSAAVALAELNRISIKVSGAPPAPIIRAAPDATTEHPPAGQSTSRLPKELIDSTEPSGQYVRTNALDRRGRISDLALSATGELAIASALGVARYRLSDGHELAYTLRSQATRQVAYGPGNLLLLADAKELQVVRIDESLPRKSQRWYSPYSAGQIAVAARGNRLAEISERDVVLREIEPHRHLYAIQADGIGAAALAPSGTWLALAIGPQVLVYELGASEARLARTFPAPAALVSALSFADAADLLAVAAADAIQVWHIPSGATRLALSGLGAPVADLALAPAGATLAVAQPGQVTLYDLRASAPAPITLEPASGAFRVAFAPDGATLAACSREAVWVWRHADRALQVALLDRYLDAVSCLGFAPDGQTLATLGGQLRLWRFVAGKLQLLATLGPHARDRNGLAFDPRGQLLASSSSDQLQLWNLAGQRALLAAVPNGAAQSHGLAFADGGQRLLMIGHGAIERYRIERRGGMALAAEPSLTPAHFPDEYSFAFAPGGAQVVAFNGHDIEVLQSNGEPLASLRAVGRVNDTAITADGRLLAAATDDGVEVWTLDPLPRALDHRDAWASLVIFAPDGQRLALINQTTIQLYRVSSGGLIDEQQLAGHNGQITDVAFRPSDNALVSAGNDGAIWLWERGQ